MAFEGNHQFDPALFIDGGQFPGQATYVTMPDGSEQLVHQVQPDELDPDLNPGLFDENREQCLPFGIFTAYVQPEGGLQPVPFCAVLVERPSLARRVLDRLLTRS